VENSSFESTKTALKTVLSSIILKVFKGVFTIILQTGITKKMITCLTQAII